MVNRSTACYAEILPLRARGVTRRVLSAPAADITTKPGDTTTLNAALNFQIMPGRLATSLIDTYSWYDQGHTDNLTTPASDTSAVGQRANVIGIALQYVFN